MPAPEREAEAAAVAEGGDCRLGGAAEPAPFVRRHIGPDADEARAMLETLGLSSLDDLIERAVPAAIRDPRPFTLDPPLDEPAARARLEALAARNRTLTPLIGMGYYGTHTPEVIRRGVLENPAWYTAYTPYQAEVSQGRMEALLNFQQMVIDLTGMELANASLLDEATAAAEAMAMARRVGKSASNRFQVDADAHPQTVAVLRTRAAPLGIEIETRAAAGLGEGPCFGVLVQYPGSGGAVPDLAAVVERARAGGEGALVVAAADPLALLMLRSPGELGADAVVGSSQRFGVPLGYGGPHAAFFATRDEYRRSTPGRIIGVSVDRHGRPALRMALQTREQHIRREKATSNICTAQVLLAVIAGLYAVYHGPQGLARIARRVHRTALALREGLARLGFETENGTFFDTLTVRVPGGEGGSGGGADAAAAIHERARARGLNLREMPAAAAGGSGGGRIGISVDETTTPEVLAEVLAAFAPEGAELPSAAELDAAAAPCLAPAMLRTDPVLTHPVFHRHRSETSMMRYLRRLAARDIALDRSMIPLGSCTMKLNAAVEMAPVTFPGFADLHPFAPREQAEGYHALMRDLEAMLCECTGFAAVSLQPNAGSQGEYAGLLVIRRYHESRGEGERDVCLIPASAHGTNPASARMAGLEVKVVRCDDDGNVDLDDLRAKAQEAGARLAALMVTYPSTHGVFEASIREVCGAVHAEGGQVYMDGANLNALLGLARPAELGADVCHINLHKTFCIPHGGGGPGMGPIGVGAHLAPFLPGHPVVGGVNPHDRAGGDGGGSSMGAVSAAPWGSAGILPISWTYVRMMGHEGLREATRVAILSANYVAARLAPHYPVLYTGQNGLVAHECILDLRSVKKSCGITVEDVAKRLVDYGFHAPTTSFPVADTLMIEPTESESKEELDRFCEAMISIREEIRAVERGEADPDDNLLRNAPHAVPLLGEDEWRAPYSRAQAIFPAPWVREDKYWPPVGRVDNAFGDRNLVCTCPPMEAYLDEAAD